MALCFTFFWMDTHVMDIFGAHSPGALKSLLLVGETHKDRADATDSMWSLSFSPVFPASHLASCILTYPSPSAVT